MTPDAGQAGAAAPVAVAPARPLRRWAVAAGTATVAAGAGWAIYRERATLIHGLRVLRTHTEPDWIIACVAMQCLSMVFFALLQQRLLKAGGARLTAPWLLSIAYLANAIAVAVPVIGSGMAATYAYQQLRDRRVDPVIAKAALALAGVVSTITFAAVVVGALLSGSLSAAVGALGSALACLIILAAGLVALRSPAGRSRLQRLFTRLLAVAQRVVRRPRGNPAQITNAAMDRLSLFRLGPATVGPALTWGTLNSAADACCLILAVKAIGVPVRGPAFCWRGALARARAA